MHCSTRTIRGKKSLNENIRGCSNFKAYNGFFPYYFLTVRYEFQTPWTLSYDMCSPLLLTHFSYICNIIHKLIYQLAFLKKKSLRPFNKRKSPNQRRSFLTVIRLKEKKSFHILQDIGNKHCRMPVWKDDKGKKKNSYMNINGFVFQNIRLQRCNRVYDTWKMLSQIKYPHHGYSWRTL